MDLPKSSIMLWTILIVVKLKISQQDVSAVQYVDYQPISYYFIFNGYLIIIIFMGMFRLHVCILSKMAEIVAVTT